MGVLFILCTDFILKPMYILNINFPLQFLHYYLNSKTEKYRKTHNDLILSRHVCFQSNLFFCRKVNTKCGFIFKIVIQDIQCFQMWIPYLEIKLFFIYFNTKCFFGSVVWCLVVWCLCFCLCLLN